MARYRMLQRGDYNQRQYVGGSCTGIFVSATYASLDGLFVRSAMTACKSAVYRNDDGLPGSRRELDLHALPCF